MSYNEVKLAEVASYISRGITPSYTDADGLCVINQKCIRNGSLSLAESRLHNESKKIVPTDKIVQPMDILVNSTGTGTLGRVAQVTANIRATVDSHVTIVRPSKEVDALFLGYAVKWRKPFIEALAEGSTGQTELSRFRLGDEITIPLPSLVEQQQIAGILYAIDCQINTNSKINDNLQQQLCAIFMERFTNNPALESIQQVPLSELCSVVTKGTTPTTLGKPFVDRGINFLKAESILDNHSLDKGKFAHIDEETHDMLKRSVIYAGDIVFTIAGTLGRFALIDSDILPANTNQAVAIIRADKGRISPEYLYACFIGNWHNDYYSKRVQQAVQANLSLTTIKSLPIPVLTQDEMVSYMALISPIIRMLKQNEMENERLAALRDTLLPRLMSGEVDVSNIDA